MVARGWGAGGAGRDGAPQPLPLPPSHPLPPPECGAQHAPHACKAWGKEAGQPLPGASSLTPTPTPLQPQPLTTQVDAGCELAVGLLSRQSCTCMGWEEGVPGGCPSPCKHSMHSMGMAPPAQGVHGEGPIAPQPWAVLSPCPSMHTPQGVRVHKSQSDHFLEACMWGPPDPVAGKRCLKEGRNEVGRGCGAHEVGQWCPLPSLPTHPPTPC
jgi:hypothetical protein